jgi:hypothetical protein
MTWREEAPERTRVTGNAAARGAEGEEKSVSILWAADSPKKAERGAGRAAAPIRERAEELAATTSKAQSTRRAGTGELSSRQSTSEEGATSEGAPSSSSGREEKQAARRSPGSSKS